MRTFLWIIIIFALSTSCQDKKSESKSVAKKVVIQDTITPIETLDEQDPSPDMGTIKEPTIKGQEDVIDFFTTYGENNPETKVRITTRFGNIEIQLYEDTPLHRANFIMLVKNGYFNTTQFHRVSPNFVVQGGNNDTQGTARNRSSFGSYLIPNEANPSHTHTRGAFSSAKYTEQNVSNATAPFEFFMVQPSRGAHHLDGDHTVFGHVTKGMSVIDEINKLEVDGSEWPLENVYMTIEIIE